MKRSSLIPVLTFALAIGVTGCKSLDNTTAPEASSKKSSPSGSLRPARPIGEIELRRQIETSRLEKDRGFRQSKDSPIPEAEREAFKGLNYFPVNSSYRFNSEMKLYDGKERIKMLTSTGEQSEYIKYGYFEFIIGSQPCRLDVFKPVFLEPNNNHLFIPFRDATSGKESYGAGRYIDLEESDDQQYTLDFNLAYNPFCAYNVRYSCPIPPRQNNLKVEVRAGEKNYH